MDGGGTGDTTPLGDLPFIRFPIRSCSSLFRASRSAVWSLFSSLSKEISEPVGVVSLRDGLVGVSNLRDGLEGIESFIEGELASRRLEGETGDAGGGISVLRADRGVPAPNPNPPADCRPLIPPGAGIPMPDVRPDVGGFGVANGDGAGAFACPGLDGRGSEPLIMPLLASCSCWAVIPIYRLAREPAVKLGSVTADLRGFAPGVAPAGATGARGRALGVVKEGVMRPEVRAGVVRPAAKAGVPRLLAESAGVTRPPPDIAGVARPLTEGVARPLTGGNEGVVRPRDDATEEGRKIGAESFAEATKTPHLGAHEKYDTLYMHSAQCSRKDINSYPLTVPSFLPRPASPGASSTPAHTPGFPSIEPIKRSVPSIPRLSMRTASPGSNVRSLPLLLPCTSDWRLSGRDDVLVEVEARGVYVKAPERALDVGVFGRGARGGAEEVEDAAEGVRAVATLPGRATDLRPVEASGTFAGCEDGEDCGETDWSLGLEVARCCFGSLARMASDNARDMLGLSSSGVAGPALAVELALERPEVGIPEPTPTGLPGVGIRPRLVVVDAVGVYMCAIRLRDQRYQASGTSC